MIKLNKFNYWKYSCAGETIFNRVNSCEQFSYKKLGANDIPVGFIVLFNRFIQFSKKSRRLLTVEQSFVFHPCSTKQTNMNKN
jgi:hypothetical protein